MTDENDRRRFYWGGTLQGSVQALVGILFFVVGRFEIYAPREPEQPAFGLALVGVPAALIGLGVIVDRRRRETPLVLVGPGAGADDPPLAGARGHVLPPGSRARSVLPARDRPLLRRWRARIRRAGPD